MHIYIYQIKRNNSLQRSTTPTKQCASDNEAEIVYNPANPLVIWICKNTTWTPFE